LLEILNSIFWAKTKIHPNKGSKAWQLDSQGYGTDIETTEEFTVFVSEYKPPKLPFPYSKEILIKSTSGSSLIDYQIPIEFNRSTFPYEAEKNGSDLRFFSKINWR
jgi:hypothetical protein